MILKYLSKSKVGLSIKQLKCTINGNHIPISQTVTKHDEF